MARIFTEVVDAQYGSEIRETFKEVDPRNWKEFGILLQLVRMDLVRNDCELSIWVAMVIEIVEMELSNHSKIFNEKPLGLTWAKKSLIK